MRYRHLLASVMALLPSLALANDTSDPQLPEALEHFVNDATLAVAIVDFDSAWVTGLQQEVARRLGEQGNQAANQPAFAVATGIIESFRAAGARQLVLVVGLNDLSPSAGPIGIITTGSDHEARAVQQLGDNFRQMGPGDLEDFQVVKGAANCVLVGQQASIDCYQKLEASPRPDIVEALNQAGENTGDNEGPQAVAVVAPGPDARRVARELWPDLPSPYAKLDGQLLAGGFVHLTVTITTPPEWQAALQLRAENERAAEQFKQLFEAAYEQMVDYVSEEVPPLGNVARQAAQLLAVEQDGNELAVRLAHDNDQIAKLFAQVFVPAVQDARAAAYRSQRMNNMKQLALAMHNFHATLKHFPASVAIVDKNGKPLLSWRVAVLPFLGERELFNQFHLDEPWDSPHNLELVKSMPSAFAGPLNPELNAEGKTRYQVPVHPRSVFPPAGDDVSGEKSSLLGRELLLASGTAIREIIDGTSNTVMIVETAPEDAVEWTRPADWEVEMAQAWKQLKGEGGDTTVTAFCDGAAHSWDHSEEALGENLPKYITRDGKEVIPR